MDALRADRSGIDPAVTGIDDDRRNVTYRWHSSCRRLGRCRFEAPPGDGAKREAAQYPTPPAIHVRMPHPPSNPRSRQVSPVNGYFTAKPPMPVGTGVELFAAAAIVVETPQRQRLGEPLPQ